MSSTDEETIAAFRREAKHNGTPFPPLPAPCPSYILCISSFLVVLCCILLFYMATSTIGVVSSCPDPTFLFLPCFSPCPSSPLGLPHYLSFSSFMMLNYTFILFKGIPAVFVGYKGSDKYMIYSHGNACDLGQMIYDLQAPSLPPSSPFFLSFLYI